MKKNERDTMKKNELIEYMKYKIGTNTYARVYTTHTYNIHVGEIMDDIINKYIELHYLDENELELEEFEEYITIWLQYEIEQIYEEEWCIEKIELVPSPENKLKFVEWMKNELRNKKLKRILI